ncbi:MAG: hypothetical protein LLF92_04910 [Planctomycetaceae bacterium]|nr:hypothetical protein [Planctomycetaceae bacterium]
MNDCCPEAVSAVKLFDWVCRKMLTKPDGRFGMYERWRINLKSHVNWVRPDCNMEMARALASYGLATDSNKYEHICENLLNWVLDAQYGHEHGEICGAFPFYKVEGKTIPKEIYTCTHWPNDLGKILRNMCWFYNFRPREDLLASAVRLADFFLRNLSSEGTFPQKGVYYNGPAFRLWPAAGLSCLYAITGEKKHADAANLVFEKLKAMQLDSGRFRSSFESPNNKGCSEDWRPVSSETAIAMKCFSIGYSVFKDDSYKQIAIKAADWISSVQHPCGGILNSDMKSEKSSLQQDHLIDLVYTQGYAVMGLAHIVNNVSDSYNECYKKLKKFLISIQCQGESENWDGAWRGSYDPVRQCWDGHCDMNNELDEGGLDSVYTGWCAAPIVIGLLGGLTTKR